MITQRMTYRLVVMTLVAIAFVFAANAAFGGKTIVVDKSELTVDDVGSLFETNCGHLTRISFEQRQIVVGDTLFKLAPKVDYYVVSKGRVSKAKGKQFMVGKMIGFQLDSADRITALYLIQEVKATKKK